MAVLATLAVTHADQASLDVNVIDPQSNDLTDTESRRVEEHEKETMLGIARAIDEPADLFFGEDGG
ncbi:hypothetical protein D3C83_271220 [compost metagenome]